MAELWIPEQQPPQVSEAAAATVAVQLLDEGLAATSNAGLDRLQTTQDAFGGYLDRFGFDLNQRFTEGLWPERVLKIGASLAFLAYRETGYFQDIDNDAFQLRQALAELEGIPAAYISSLFADEQLLSVIDTAQAAPDLQAPDPSAYRQVFGLGAGCMRYYLQAAVVVA